MSAAAEGLRIADSLCLNTTLQLLRLPLYPEDTVNKIKSIQ